MWEIYDRLIEGIPDDWIAEQIVRGVYYVCVKSEGSVGISSPSMHDRRMPIMYGNYEGKPLKDLAKSIKSWNYPEASLGLAALNAYYNHPDILAAAGLKIEKSLNVEDRIYDPFIMSQNDIRGKRVAMFGRFPHIETLIEPVCKLSVISSLDFAENDDYPLASAEYIFPESDFVFIGSSSIDTKLLPRFLQLSAKAEKVTIVGPATTLSPILFEYGVDDLSGFVVKSIDKAIRIAAGAETDKIFASGQKVSFQKQMALPKR